MQCGETLIAESIAQIAKSPIPCIRRFHAPCFGLVHNIQNAEWLILRPQQVCKDSDSFHIQPFLSLVF